MRAWDAFEHKDIVNNSSKRHELGYQQIRGLGECVYH